MTNKSTTWTVLIYGLLILGFGLLGYYKGGSAISLYTGGSFGLLLILSSVLMFCKIQSASYAALVLTLGLTFTFAIRYSMTHKGIPAILAVISGCMLLFLLARVVPWKK